MEHFRLKVFRTVADTLNFRQAAEALCLTQPAITLQIKALEEELGVSLFDRTGKKVSLTEAGRILVRHAKKVEALTAVARQQLAALVGEVEGNLSAGASTTIARYLLPKLIGEFQKANPRIRLSLLGANTEKIVQGVPDGTLAIGLIEGPSLHREAGEEPFVRDEIVLVVPSKHEWAGQQIEAKDLYKVPLILREIGSGTRRVVAAVLKSAGIQMKHARVVMELDSTEAIKSAIEAGLGVGFPSRRSIPRERQLYSLHEVRITGLLMQRRFALIYPAGPAPRGVSGEFLRFLREKRDQAHLPKHDR
jgi:LysR family transcriptional regulator, transcriptional activator of the cysJI operon